MSRLQVVLAILAGGLSLIALILAFLGGGASLFMIMTLIACTLTLVRFVIPLSIWIDGAMTLFGATALYLVSCLSAMRRFDGRRVTLSLDEAGPIEMLVSMVAVANGRYFGGGMKVAPDANPGDGELDIVVLLQEPRVRPMEMRLVYAGAHLSHPAVRAMRCRRLSAQCTDGRPVSIEADGEIVGLAPAAFEVVPDALTLLW